MLNSHKFYRLTGLMACLISVQFNAAAQKVHGQFIRLGTENDPAEAGHAKFYQSDAGSFQITELRNISQPIGSIYGKFIAYNAIDEKIYLADVSDGINTEITTWVVADQTIRKVDDFNLYNKVITQFDFDKKGVMYSLEDYKSQRGEAYIVAYTICNGTLKELSEKKLTFPKENRPSDIKSGDIACTENGKMYILTGYGHSHLYEIKNFAAVNPQNAEAVAVAEIPEVCYSIFPDKDRLVLAGNNLRSENYSYSFDPESKNLSKDQSSNNSLLFFETTAIAPKEQERSFYHTTSEINVFENYSKGLLEISHACDVTSNLEIINAHGGRVYFSKAVKGKAFDLNHFSNGLYIARFWGNGIATSSRTFTISR